MRRGGIVIIHKQRLQSVVWGGGGPITPYFFKFIEHYLIPKKKENPDAPKIAKRIPRQRDFFLLQTLQKTWKNWWVTLAKNAFCISTVL